jgi:hypothetical protein
MRLALAAAVLVAGCSDRGRRDATEEEVRSAAAKCGAVVTRLDRSAEERKNRNRELGIPHISVTIAFQSDAEFSTKANCIDRELNTLGAYSRIGGPNGEDLLVSSGVDRIQ